MSFLQLNGRLEFNPCNSINTRYDNFMDKYGIIATETTHHEGDQRSRDAPGHGYPAHSTSSEVITMYENKEKWEEAIRRKSSAKYGRPDKFTAIIYRVVEVETQINIKID